MSALWPLGEGPDGCTPATGRLNNPIYDLHRAIIALSDRCRHPCDVWPRQRVILMDGVTPIASLVMPLQCRLVRRGKRARVLPDLGGVPGADDETIS
jgi:hypothetical protein